MAVTLGAMTLRILAQVEGSPVQNEIGSIEVDMTLTPLDRSVHTGAPAEATMVADFNIPAALRQMADEIERG